MEITIRSRTVNQSRQRIWGHFHLSNRAVVHFKATRENDWQQWGSGEPDLYITMPIVEQLTADWRGECEA